MPAARGSSAAWSPGSASIVFAAFGLFVGYLVPSENVMQLIGPALALLAFIGGLFLPLDQLRHTLQTHRQVHPGLRGRRARPRALLTRERSSGAVAQRRRVAGIFAVGAVCRFRRDTARV